MFIGTSLSTGQAPEERNKVTTVALPQKYFVLVREAD